MLSAITTLAAVVTALAAAVIGPLIQLRIAKAQIVASSLSTKRQEWINSLRSELAAVSALVREMAVALRGKAVDRRADYPELHDKFMAAFAKIELLINPLEHDHESLLKAIDDYYKAVVVLPAVSGENKSYGAYRALFVLWSQLVLKKEWTVIRDGKPDEGTLSKFRAKIREISAGVEPVQKRFDRAAAEARARLASAE